MLPASKLLLSTALQIVVVRSASGCAYAVVSTVVETWQFFHHRLSGADFACADPDDTETAIAIFAHICCDTVCEQNRQSTWRAQRLHWVVCFPRTSILKVNLQLSGQLVVAIEFRPQQLRVGESECIIPQFMHRLHGKLVRYSTAQWSSLTQFKCMQQAGTL